VVCLAREGGGRVAVLPSLGGFQLASDALALRGNYLGGWAAVLVTVCILGMLILVLVGVALLRMLGRRDARQVAAVLRSVGHRPTVRIGVRQPMATGMGPLARFGVAST